jgi:hypothetical protein
MYITLSIDFYVMCSKVVSVDITATAVQLACELLYVLGEMPENIIREVAIVLIIAAKLATTLAS